MIRTQLALLGAAITAAALLALPGAAGTATAATATAATATIHPATLNVKAPLRPAYPYGPCYGWNDKNTFGGWCTGAGPASYYAIARCMDGSWSYGIIRWDGDTRKSYAYCAGHGGLNQDWGFGMTDNSGHFVAWYTMHGTL